MAGTRPSLAEAREITRLRSDNDKMRAGIRQIERRQRESDRRARRAEIEDRISRLALEVELDEAAETDRLSRLPASAVDAEIELMRSRYRPRPRMGEPGDEDTVAGTSIRIFGEAVARMALEAEGDGTPIAIHRDGHRGISTRRRDALRLARAAVKRFCAERDTVTRA